MAYKKTTIKEVARASGVSTQTVSRVLNERLDVAAETRLRVLQVIAEMGYAPSALARGMIRQRSLTIGVLFSRLSLNGSSASLDAILAEADRLGYTLLLKEIPGLEINQTDRLLRSLLDYHVDGILWAVPQTATESRLLGMDFPVPAVLLNTGPVPAQTVIGLDYFRSGYLATRHLIEQGYQSIGHISGPLTWWEASECRRGWAKALDDAGRTIPESALVSGDWTPASGCLAAARLFFQYPQMDAIFSANSQMALGALLEASRRKKRIPADLGLVAFDDASDSDFFCPPLTIVAQDYARLGQTAMQKLAELIEADQNDQEYLPSRLLIEPKLMVHESTFSAKPPEANWPGRQLAVPVPGWQRA